MKKIILSLVLALTIVSLIAVPVFAAGPSKMSGNSDTGHVNLVSKNADWTVNEDGACGKFNYQISVADPVEDTMVSGVFNGVGLEPGIEYALIYYKEPQTIWPTPVVCLGIGIANGGGNVNIAAEGKIGGPDAQPNALSPGEGDKIWLVPALDLNADGDRLVGWNPGSILFEETLIQLVPTPSP